MKKKDLWKIHVQFTVIYVAPHSGNKETIISSNSRYLCFVLYVWMFYITRTKVNKILKSAKENRENVSTCTNFHDIISA